MEDKRIKYTLTIPNELLEDVKNIATKKGMSVNDYIVIAISERLGLL